MPADAAYDAYQSARRFDALDGLRTAAAAAVVWHHAGGEATGYFGRGVGATTFFVISGYLVTWLLLRERRERGTISLRDFWWRRALRIFPLYYAVLAVYIVLVDRLERGTPAGQRFFESLPYYVSFTTNWFVVHRSGERISFYFAWSLALQEQFYLVWPAILRFTRRRYAFCVPITFLVVGDVATWLVEAGHLDGGTAYRIVASVDSPIFLGVVLAFLVETRRGFRLVHAVAGQPWSIPLATALAVAPRWIPAVPQSAVVAFIAYLVAACVLAPPAWASAIDNRLVRHVAKVSFGIYLLHMLALNAVRRAVPGATQFAVFALGLPLAVLMASASHRWFEQYFLRFRRERPGVRDATPALAPDARDDDGAGLATVADA